MNKWGLEKCPIDGTGTTTDCENCRFNRNIIAYQYNETTKQCEYMHKDKQKAKKSHIKPRIMHLTDMEDIELTLCGILLTDRIRTTTNKTQGTCEDCIKRVRYFELKKKAEHTGNDYELRMEKKRERIKQAQELRKLEQETRDTLITTLYKQNMPIWEMSEKMKMTPPTLRRHLHRLGLILNLKEKIAKAEELVKTKMTNREISRDLRISETMVSVIKRTYLESKARPNHPKSKCKYCGTEFPKVTQATICIECLKEKNSIANIIHKARKDFIKLAIRNPGEAGLLVEQIRAEEGEQFREQLLNGIPEKLLRKKDELEE